MRSQLNGGSGHPAIHALPVLAMACLVAGTFLERRTLAAYGLYWWLLRRVGITTVNALLFLVAPTTAGAGALLLGEPLTFVTVAGFVLCGAGVAAVLVAEVRSRGEQGLSPVVALDAASTGM